MATIDDLVISTTALTDAVQTQKTILDASVLEAQTAANTAVAVANSYGYVAVGGTGTELQAALLTVPITTTIVVTDTQTLTGGTIVAHPIEVRSGGLINVGSGTVTFTNSFDAGLYQCFSGVGVISFSFNNVCKAIWFGTPSATAFQKAIDAASSGSTLSFTGITGVITIATQLIVNKSLIIEFGNITITSNLTTSQWLVTASGVSFIGQNPYLSKLTSTNTVTGNIIQWGQISVSHSYTDLVVSGITFTLPTITNAVDSYRTHMGAIVAVCESISALTPNNRITVKDCVFNEGADQISLEQTYYHTIKNCVFNNTKGRGINVWNSDYGLYDGNTFIDTAGTAINFNEAFQTGALNKACDYITIVNNTVYGTKYEGISVRGNGWIVSNNKLFDVRGTGIAITEAGTSATVITCKNAMVSNNNIFITGGGIGQCGINMATNYTVKPSNCKITSNSITMTGGTFGVVVIGDNNYVGFNYIMKTGATAANYDGIQAANCTQLDIKSNNISGFNRNGMYINTCSYVRVINNTSKDNISIGMRLGSCTNSVISDNVASGNDYGLYIDGTPTYNMFLSNSNIFYNNTTTNKTTPVVIYKGNNSIQDASTLPTSGYAFDGDVTWVGAGASAGASPGWVCTTPGYIIRGAWTNGVTYLLNEMVTNAGNVYLTTNGGVAGATAPTHVVGTVSDGTVNWLFIATSASVATFKAMASVTA